MILQKGSRERRRGGRTERVPPHDLRFDKILSSIMKGIGLSKSFLLGDSFLALYNGEHIRHNGLLVFSDDKTEPQIRVVINQSSLQP
jgi:hypothetical protein